MSLISTLKDKFFQPKSPVEGTGTVKQSSAEATGESAQTSNADYRLDLALQNLLSIGSEFSPDDIISLRRRARYGDPRWLYSLYDEMMRLGPAPQVLKAREAIKATDTVWHATPDEADEDENSDNPKDKAARLIRDVAEEAWDGWLPDLKTHLSTKYFYGIAAVQVMWKPGAIEGRWSKVTDIRPIPARRFRLDPNTMRFKFLTDPYSFEGPFVDELQATGKLVFVEVGADVEPLDQRGLLFQCSIPWAIEQFTVRWRAKRLQNFGMPPVLVTYQKNDPQSKAAADKLADVLANGTRASTPSDMKADLLAAPGAGSRGGDPYESNIEWCERAYDKIILGHSQVSGVQQGAGSRSSSKDAIGLFKDVTNSRAKELDNDVKQQCLYPYVAREFGPDWADDHCPEVRSAVVERDDPTELSTVALNLFNAGAAGAIAVEDIVERCTLKVPEDGELTLAGNVKGDQPSPAEVDAENKANPPSAAQGVGSDVPQPASPATLAKGSKPGTPGAKPVHPPASAGAATKGGSFMSLADFEPAASAVLRKRKKATRLAAVEFYTKRQRFGAAALIGGRPRITLTTFGHEYGAPDDTAQNFDVRSLSATRPFDAARTGQDAEVKASIVGHPMTGAVYGGVKSRVLQTITAATLTGTHELRLGIGCEHGKHRSVYVAERLAQDLRNDGHDVTVEHRDAHDPKRSGERGLTGPIGIVPNEPEQQFYSDTEARVATGSGAGEWTTGSSPTAAAAQHAQAANEHASQAVAVGATPPPTPTAAPLVTAAAAAHVTASKAHAKAAKLHLGKHPKAAHASRQAHRLSRTAHAKTKHALPHATHLHKLPSQHIAHLRHVKHGADASAAEQFYADETPLAAAKREKLRIEAKVAARVHARMKRQYALALEEADHKLKRVE